MRILLMTAGSRGDVEPFVALAKQALEQAATRHPDVRLAKVNAEAEPDVAFAAMISAVPPLLVYPDGEVVRTELGGLTATELDALIRARSDCGGAFPAAPA